VLRRLRGCQREGIGTVGIMERCGFERETWVFIEVGNKNSTNLTRAALN
jgi:hypothetical protein